MYVSTDEPVHAGGPRPGPNTASLIGDDHRPPLTESTAVVINGHVATLVGRGQFTGDVQKMVFQLPSMTSTGTANVDVWQGPACTSTTASVSTRSPRILLDIANNRAQILRANLQSPGDCMRGPFRLPPVSHRCSGRDRVYAIGLGPVENPPSDGVPAVQTGEYPAVTATVGGKPAEVLWAGLHRAT